MYGVKFKFFAFLLVLSAAIIPFSQKAQADSNNTVYIININDFTINPITAEYITNAIDKATSEKAVCLIVPVGPKAVAVGVPPPVAALVTEPTRSFHPVVRVVMSGWDHAPDPAPSAT